MRPLLAYCVEDRVHASLNLNTETGRLSSRQPNLQGEPNGGAFPIRSTFVAPPGRILLVSDYAQLELRLVAHLANCAPMIEILSAGGDIHSGTAYKMFDDVKRAVDSGEVCLDESAAKYNGTPDLPLVSEQFAEFRKLAKTLNFAVLYGKTAFSFAKEWGVEKAEAQAFINKWFAAFPEVRYWKSMVERKAKEKGARTLLGRARPLRNLSSNSMPVRAAAQRVAGNSPVQGSAADVVILAMLKINDSECIKRLGFQQIMQVHDELLLEGPEEHAEEALEELVRIMEDPLPWKLSVPLVVNARCSKSWHRGGD